MDGTSLSGLFRLLEDLKREEVLEEYAIVGAIAALFYAEATPTFDLDVAAIVPESEGALLSLEPLYRALAERGFHPDGPHVLVEGVPVQFLPGDRGLWREVVEQANRLGYDGTPVRVATAEHLVAMAFDAPESRRLLRALALLESPGFDRQALSDILSRHGIRDRTPPSG